MSIALSGLTIDASCHPTPKETRDLIRSGVLTGHTSSLAPGFVQANLAILPTDWADEFLLFCQRNPKPCPLIAVTRPGEPVFETLGDNVDVRTDVSRYKVFRDGVLVDEPNDIDRLWRDDLVAFAIGCSFSFEEALVEAGLRLRHCDEGRNVPMYRTNLPTQSTTRFSGPTVVSMRPFTPADAIRAVQVTSRFPNVHGAPIHLGDPGAIGIADLTKPDFGDAVTVNESELPVFWACGVTPQAVIAEARPPFVITHHPGCMLITDLRNAQMAVF